MSESESLGDGDCVLGTVTVSVALTVGSEVKECVLESVTVASKEFVSVDDPGEVRDTLSVTTSVSVSDVLRVRVNLAVSVLSLLGEPVNVCIPDSDFVNDHCSGVFEGVGDFRVSVSSSEAVGVFCESVFMSVCGYV